MIRKMEIKTDLTHEQYDQLVSLVSEKDNLECHEEKQSLYLHLISVDANLNPNMISGNMHGMFGDSFFEDKAGVRYSVVIGVRDNTPEDRKSRLLKIVGL